MMRTRGLRTHAHDQGTHAALVGCPLRGGGLVADSERDAYGGLSGGASRGEEKECVDSLLKI